jgi:hypothetical protein
VYIVEEEEAQRVSINIEESAADLWHRRLAHTNHKDVLELQSSSISIDQFTLKSKPFGDHVCEGYLAGKIKESFSKQTNSRIKERIRKLYYDILRI